jgi:Tfp pilus assembly protein PilO
MSSINFHISIIALLVAVLTITIVGFIMARNKVREYEGKVNETLNRLNDVSDKTNRILSAVNLDDVRAQVKSLGNRLGALCDREFPLGIGRLC